jgi:hypothetical protein
MVSLPNHFTAVSVRHAKRSLCLSYYSLAPPTPHSIPGSTTSSALADTETSLMGTISSSRNQSHHVLANLNSALVRVRSRHLDCKSAFETVSLHSLSHTFIFILNYHKSIRIRPSLNGHIGHSLALLGGLSHWRSGTTIPTVSFKPRCVFCAWNLVDRQLLISLRLSSFWNLLAPRLSGWSLN